MTGGLCVCVLMVVLCRGCLGLPYSSQLLGEGQHSSLSPLEAHLDADTHALGEHELQQSHSHSKDLPAAKEDEDTRANLSELLARLISSRKASVRRNSNTRSSTDHQIADRDYMGWIDFGRRSAEEYGYSS